MFAFIQHFSSLLEHGSYVVFNGVSESGRTGTVVFPWTATNAYVYRYDPPPSPKGPQAMCLSLSLLRGVTGSLCVGEQLWAVWQHNTPAFLPCEPVFIWSWQLHWASLSLGGPRVDDCCCLYPGSSVSVALQASPQSLYFEPLPFFNMMKPNNMRCDVILESRNLAVCTKRNATETFKYQLFI